MNQITDETLKLLKEDHDRIREFELDLQKFEDFIESSKKRFEKMEVSIEDVKGMIAKIMNNHLFHISNDITAIKRDFFWIKVIGAFIIVQGVGVLTAVIFR